MEDIWLAVDRGLNPLSPFWMMLFGRYPVLGPQLGPVNWLCLLFRLPLPYCKMPDVRSTWTDSISPYYHFNIAPNFVFISLLSLIVDCALYGVEVVIR